MAGAKKRPPRCAGAVSNISQSAVLLGHSVLAATAAFRGGRATLGLAAAIPVEVESLAARLATLRLAARLGLAALGLGLAALGLGLAALRLGLAAAVEAELFAALAATGVLWRRTTAIAFFAQHYSVHQPDGLGVGVAHHKQ